MILSRTLLTFTLVTVLWFNAGCGLPNKRSTEDTDAVDAEDDYNPQCLPLDYFEKGQSEETRAKRDDEAALAAGETATKDEADELVAQPGYVVPARKRRPCVGRRRNFTKDCGPRQRAYRVKNFVMAPHPGRRFRPHKI